MHDDPAGKHDEESQRRTEKSKRARAKGRQSRADLIRQHPVRAAILAILDKHAKDEGLTMREVHEHLSDDHPIAAVAYHLRVLLGAKLVKAIDNRGERGSIERVWALA